MQGRYRIDLVVRGEKITKLYVTSYRKGNLAIVLYNEIEPWCHLSVNLEDQAHLLDDNEFFAKSYAEGKETFEAMHADGLIELCGGKGLAGMHGSAPICRLTAKALLSPIA